jgi:ATP-dependent exoDNAse (exonuclease V) beta subunit
LARWDALRVARLRGAFARELGSLGVPEAQLPAALDRVERALSCALADPRARWVLGPHAEASCELALTGVLDGKLVDIVIDRTFVDERGVRWIVDYKTGMHEGGDLASFLDSEQARYREQLERYAALLAQAGAEPIRVALYFPLLPAWREWQPG